MAIWSILFTVLLALFLGVKSEFIPYNTAANIVPGKINVHLVPHSHDDCGWLKTIDEYYVGLNNSIRAASVQNVLDSVIAALSKDVNRKFVYVEMAYFQRWWRQQSPNVKKTVKNLLSVGQLEFVNGGMCMHDEATTYYIDMIDQTTLGHRFLKDVFQQVPRIGWQIDPYGHSAVQAYLLSAKVGFDALYFARIDYQNRAKRKENKTLEVVWRGSKSLGSTSQIFTSIFPKSYYPPDGFRFEVNDVSDPIQDDPLLFDYNVQKRVDDFVAAARSQARVTRTNHIMWSMGGDFNYQYAESWFRQMDKFIHYVNLDGRVNALYSTPSMYTNAIHKTSESWPLKTGDFFPYADRVNAYWTGYFTSRPSFKRYVRVLSGYYLAARQLEYLKGRNASASATDKLADALAIAQHHDALTGSERQHVNDDYTMRLHIGYSEAEQLVSSSLTSLTSKHGESTTTFEQCPLLNVSYCQASETFLSQRKDLVVVVYNALGWKREEVIQIPVTMDTVTVLDSDGNVVDAQLLRVTQASLRLRNEHVNLYLGKNPENTPRYWLAFPVSVPPLGFSTYILSPIKAGASTTLSNTTTIKGNTTRSVEIGSGNLKLQFSADEGKLIFQYANARNLIVIEDENKNAGQETEINVEENPLTLSLGRSSEFNNVTDTEEEFDALIKVNATVEQSYSYYKAFSGTDEDPQASTAVIFRPNGTVPIEVKPEGQASFTVMKGPLVDEVHQQLSPWIHQITRVYKEKEHGEMEFTIGPIPVDDGVGKEIITQITTDLRTKKAFYTDSNGRDFIKRIRNYRADYNLEVDQPVAGNYYPINLGIFVNDSNMELSVLVDRAVGGSSMKDGQIELMLHRRLLYADRAIGEALNETVCILKECKGLTIKGKYFFRIDRIGKGAQWRRSAGQEIYSPLVLAFSELEKDWKKNKVLSFSGFNDSYSLPENVAIITLQELDCGGTLLRLAHLYEIGEHEVLSAMAHVKLKQLFPEKEIAEVTEMSLSANQERAEMERKRLAWNVGNPSEEEPKVSRGGPVDPVSLVVELAPMEIRTFVVKFQYIRMHGV